MFVFRVRRVLFRIHVFQQAVSRWCRAIKRRAAHTCNSPSTNIRNFTAECKSALSVFNVCVVRLRSAAGRTVWGFRGRAGRPVPEGMKKREAPISSTESELLLSLLAKPRWRRLISCRALRRIRSVSYGLSHDGRPIRGDRWRSACADGNHACCFSCGCEVGMFFSFCYAVFIF